ncbi:hypothetical protein JB92DRAFT_85386 [Gautieria morchelliformis]|nr:hypothetical protein JB92DRAFT_85386 [Gautieria morchelliformis]
MVSTRCGKREVTIRSNLLYDPLQIIMGLHVFSHRPCLQSPIEHLSLDDDSSPYVDPPPAPDPSPLPSCLRPTHLAFPPRTRPPPPCSTCPRLSLRTLCPAPLQRRPPHAHSSLVIPSTRIRSPSSTFTAAPTVPTRQGNGRHCRMGGLPPPERGLVERRTRWRALSAVLEREGLTLCNPSSSPATLSFTLFQPIFAVPFSDRRRPILTRPTALPIRTPATPPATPSSPRIHHRAPSASSPAATSPAHGSLEWRGCGARRFGWRPRGSPGTCTRRRDMRDGACRQFSRVSFYNLQYPPHPPAPPRAARLPSAHRSPLESPRARCSAAQFKGVGVDCGYGA